MSNSEPAGQENPWVIAFIGLGSNIGDRQQNLRRALVMLGELPKTALLRCSRFLETLPMGYLDQQKFINSVAQMETGLEPVELLKHLKEIEKLMGRKPTIRWGPRIIDLDILLYGRLVLDSEQLTIPHEQLENRTFVLEGLLELDGSLVNPRSGRPLAEALRALENG